MMIIPVSAAQGFILVCIIFTLYFYRLFILLHGALSSTAPTLVNERERLAVHWKSTNSVGRVT